MPISFMRLTCANCGVLTEYPAAQDRPVGWASVRLNFLDGKGYIMGGLDAPELCPSCGEIARTALKQALKVARGVSR